MTIIRNSILESFWELSVFEYHEVHTTGEGRPTLATCLTFKIIFLIFLIFIQFFSRRFGKVRLVLLAKSCIDPINEFREIDF